MFHLIRRKWRALTLVATVSLVLCYFGLSLVIDYQVRGVARQAQAEVPGDAVSALLATVISAEKSLPTRNRAVWALGRLGDPRALPVLEQFRTGKPCDHMNDLCQHELAKAAARCRAGVVKNSQVGE